MSKAVIAFCTLSIGLVVGGLAHAEPLIEGRVVAVSDGDTVTILTSEKQQVKVRLAEIDAPEKAQAFGHKSKQSLSEICFDKSAVIDVQDIDRYGRTVARVVCSGVDANAEQVKRGFAWVYDRYVKDRSLYAMQDLARQNNRGLWGDVAPVPPWDFRRFAKLKRDGS